MNEQIKGYKVFEPDWTCRGFRYTCPGVFEEDVIPKCCSAGFHFCLKPVDCFNYYPFNPKYHVAEVVALGDISGREDGDEDGDSKVCTNKIQIVRELSWVEVLNLVNEGMGNTGVGNTGDHNTGNNNTGDRNTGRGNTGDWNTGDWNTGRGNTGDYNTGDLNTGFGNTGDWNAGSHNTGSHNTGEYNAGRCNAGDFNTGDFNTGDWNAGFRNTGCFNTTDSTINMFNRPSNWTYRDWERSKARYILSYIPLHICQDGHPINEEDPAEIRQTWWRRLDQSERDEVMNLPNFDKGIFKEITGVDVDDI